MSARDSYVQSQIYSTENATLVNTDKNTFSLTLDEPIFWERDLKHAKIAVTNAQIWNTVPNILTDQNDRFYIKYGAFDSYVQFSQGQYSLSNMNDTLKRLMGAESLPEDLIELIPDTATSKVVVKINYAAVEIDFSETNTMWELLGMLATTVITSPASPLPYNFSAPNIAQFGAIRSFLIHSDLVPRGIGINSKNYNVIASVPLSLAQPGSLINYAPDFLEATLLDVDHLIGHARSTLQFWLTDQNNELINTGGEEWNLTLLFIFNY